VTPEEWQRAKEILEVAISRPAHERRAYVADACGDNVNLREEIESLLTSWDDPLEIASLGGGRNLSTDDASQNPAVGSLSPDRTKSATGGGVGPVAPDAPNTALSPGSSVGPYQICALLGAGGMGIVYLARDTRLDRDVAIKVLPTAFASDAHRRRRFEHEARAAASLNHPNIVSVHDVGLDDGVPFIVMEYVRGETLSMQMRRGRVPRGRALQIGSDIAAALIEAHAHNVAHRDLKPGNVMVTPEGFIKVLDFGIAKTALPDPGTTAPVVSPAAGHHTRQGQLLGTPGYMSPEQLLGRSVDHRTDIYSLGVILFELVSGQRPFKDRDLIALRLAALTAPVRSACEVDPSVPAAVADLIAQAMAPEPAARQSAAVLRAELNALMDRTVTLRPDLPSVAVLSFADMSPSKDQEFFCDGMAEELINALTQISGLRVAARTSAFQFKGKARDVRLIGDALNVATVLDGSVRKAGNQLRVTVELIGSSDGYQLWSERFDGNLEDIFAVQEQIANSVVATLKGRLAVPTTVPAAAQRRRNLEAYGFYLEGRYHWNKRTEDELKKSVACFERAIERDPGYAEAYAAMADAYVTLGTYGARPASDMMPRAKAALDRALEIDAELAEAYACRGCVRSVYDWTWADAEDDYRKAIALQPAYPTAHHWYGINHLVPMARFEEATGELRRALEVDPLALAVRTSLGMTAYFAGQYDAAVRELLKTIELEDHFAMARIFLGATYTEQRRFPEAREELEAAIRLSGRTPEILAALGYLHGLSGDAEGARRVLDDLKRLSGERYVSPARLAQVHIGLNERTEALDRLEEARAERAADLAWLGVRPVFASLRAEPRFQALLRDVGLVNRKLQ
jgi:serine/threonine protein kinase/tetratricopeptide (TPR) repeat protein